MSRKKFLDEDGLGELIALNATTYEPQKNKIGERSIAPDADKFPNEVFLLNEVTRFELTSDELDKIIN